jgi:hypothetical protein
MNVHTAFFVTASQQAYITACQSRICHTGEDNVIDIQSEQKACN